MAAAEPGLPGSNSGGSPDLNPTIPSERIFSKWDVATLWISIVVGVPTYYLAGSLVEQGMSWYQGVATVLAGNTIILFPLILLGHPGTRYGIPFPVLARAAFGIHGAHVATLLRSLVSCGWFGIETWIGGEAISLLLPSSIQESWLAGSLPWLGTSLLKFLCFLVFWLLQLASIWKGMHGIKILQKFSAPILVFLTLALLSWAYIKAGGFGKMLSLPSTLSNSEFWSLFFPSLTACAGGWSGVSLNIPDFTRYAKKQSDQILGQIGLPLFMGIFAFVGLVITSSTEVIFGHVISNPVILISKIGGGLFITILAMFGITISVITTNIPANVVAPANALVSLCPSVFTFRRGALLTALFGLICQPWRLFQSSETYVYTWMIGYSCIMGPIVGIILVDYYVLRRMVLNVNSLYSTSSHGAYYYFRGYNLSAMAALIIGILPEVPGYLHKVGIVGKVPQVFVNIYGIGWFVSFFGAGIVYWLLSHLMVTTHKAEYFEELFLLTESS